MSAGRLASAYQPASWRIAIAWVFGIAVVGCAHALAARSAQYATLGEKTAAALQPVSSLAHRTCLQTARTEFLQQRLLRLKAKSFGKELDASYYIDQVHW